MSFRVVIIQSLLFVLAVVPAIAGPREDTLAGISRCTALSDDRAFLECIYGAAQPLRARLGLLPALDAQVRLVPPAPAALPHDASSHADMPPAITFGTRCRGCAGQTVWRRFVTHDVLQLRLPRLIHCYSE